MAVAVLCFALLESDVATNILLVVGPVVIVCDHLKIIGARPVRIGVFVCSVVIVYLGYFLAFPNFVPNRIFEFIPTTIGLGIAMISLDWVISKLLTK